MECALLIHVDPLPEKNLGTLRGGRWVCVWGERRGVENEMCRHEYAEFSLKFTSHPFPLPSPPSPFALSPPRFSHARILSVSPPSIPSPCPTCAPPPPRYPFAYDPVYGLPLVQDVAKYGEVGGGGAAEGGSGLGEGGGGMHGEETASLRRRGEGGDRGRKGFGRWRKGGGLGGKRRGGRVWSEKNVLLSS